LPRARKKWRPVRPPSKFLGSDAARGYFAGAGAICGAGTVLPLAFISEK
jgi:hypothetical protein